MKKEEKKSNARSLINRKKGKRKKKIDTGKEEGEALTKTCSRGKEKKEKKKTKRCGEKSQSKSGQKKKNKKEICYRAPWSTRVVQMMREHVMSVFTAGAVIQIVKKMLERNLDNGRSRESE